MSTRHNIVSGALGAGARAALEAAHGQVWDSPQLWGDFAVHRGLDEGLRLIVTRKSDGAMGTVGWQHNPRYYWGFRAYREES